MVGEVTLHYLIKAILARFLHSNYFSLFSLLFLESRSLSSPPSRTVVLGWVVIKLHRLERWCLRVS